MMNTPPDRTIVPLPLAQSIGGGVRSPAGARGVFRYALVSLRPLRWPGRRMLRYRAPKIILALWIAVVALTTCAVVSSILVGDWYGLAVLIISFALLVLAMLCIGLAVAARPGVTYANARATVYLHFNTKKGRVWTVDNHIKTKAARPDDARELRRAVLRVLLPVAQHHGLTVNFAAATHDLADRYEADVREVAGDLGIDGGQLTRRPAPWRAKIPLVWTSSTSATLPS